MDEYIRIIVISFTLSAIGGAIVGFGLSELRHQRRSRPAALPGRSREEYETDEFILAMHKSDTDDVRLKQWKPKRSHKAAPLAIAATPHVPHVSHASPHLTTDSMRRVRVYMDQRRRLPVR